MLSSKHLLQQEMEECPKIPSAASVPVWLHCSLWWRCPESSPCAWKSVTARQSISHCEQLLEWAFHSVYTFCVIVFFFMWYTEGTVMYEMTNASCFWNDRSWVCFGLLLLLLVHSKLDLRGSHIWWDPFAHAIVFYPVIFMDSAYWVCFCCWHTTI